MNIDALRTALSDRYAITRELGAGGMATVYLAEDIRHHRRVAIKVLHPELSTLLGPERFRREIELTASLQHPHILPLFDSGSAGGLYYYVMPYVEGETLHDCLAREKQLPVDDALRIVSEIADALDYAHKRGVVHRDIKPDNILLHDGHALVADFGIALVARQPDGERMTQTGMSLGTPQYMSPEQAAGDRAVDGRSDIYALGCLLYEMLVGEPPFPGNNAQTVIARVLTETPHPPGRYRNTVPSAVDAAVLRALAKAPFDRFATASEFASALTAHPQRRPWSLTRRLTRSVALAAAVVVVVAAVGMTLWLQARGPDDVVPDTLTRSIAVLPFQNLNADSGNAYFADGVQDEILTRLATLGGLKVISRTSTAKYASQPENLRVVGQQLGVTTVLEGSVQYAGDRVRINVQLIDVATDSHIWAETYDRDLVNIFEVESEVAQKIADALRIRLEPGDVARLAAVPTQDPVAYDLYLQAQQVFRRAVSTQGWIAIPAAIAAYKKVVEQDSTFALAWTQLAFSQALLNWTGMDRSRTAMNDAESWVRKALALQPDLPEAHMVLGYVYRWGYQDFDKAMAEYQIAAARLPNSADVAAAIGFVHFIRGDVPPALRQLERATVLDPRDPHWPAQLAISESAIGNYDLAHQALSRALAVDSGAAEVYLIRSRVSLLSGASPGSVLAALDSAPQATQGSGMVQSARIEALLLDRNFAGARRIAERLTVASGLSPLQIASIQGDVLWLAGLRTEAAKRYATAFELLQRELPTTTVPIQAYAENALAAARLGRSADAGAYGDSVASLAKRGVIPLDNGITPWLTVARAYASMGRTEDAVAALRSVLARPSGYWLSGPLLREDPTWDPIRQDAGFAALMSDRSTQ